MYLRSVGPFRSSCCFNRQWILIRPSGCCFNCLNQLIHHRFRLGSFNHALGLYHIRVARRDGGPRLRSPCHHNCRCHSTLPSQLPITLRVRCIHREHVSFFKRKWSHGQGSGENSTAVLGLFGQGKEGRKFHITLISQ